MSKTFGKIFIDPGHGGGDSGAVNGEWKEKDVNLAVGLRLRNYLLAAGHEVRMSRESDDQTTLVGICKDSNDWGADFFISVHCNSYTDPRAAGIETWYYGQVEAAKKMQSALMEYFGGEHANRGIKQGSFYVLRNTVAPALLVEVEFISNPLMAEWLYRPETQADYARVIGRALGEIVG